MTGFNKCFEALVPEEHKTDGVEADFILYVTLSNEAAITNAWGNYCAYDAATNQPTAGQIHINVSNFDTVTQEQYIAYAA
jgi:hypothetical protein